MSDKIKVKGMGLLNAVSIASTLIQANEYTKLKALEEEGRQEEFEKLFLSYIKDAIFKLNSKAEDAVAEKVTNPKYAAAVLKMLSAKLANSAVKVENFEDLQDKTYASNTRKFITDNEAEISSKLSVADAKDVQDAVACFKYWSDMDYYMKSNTAFQSYEEARLKSSSSTGCIVPIIMYILSFIIPYFALLGENTSTSTFTAILIFVACLSAGLLIGGIVYWAVAYGRKKKAKQTVEEFESFFDAEKLRDIEEKFKSSLGDVKSQMEINEEMIVTLIGKMPSFD
jgi:hypothetical protein